jgi:hypothetical protein
VASNNELVEARSKKRVVEGSIPPGNNEVKLKEASISAANPI